METRLSYTLDECCWVCVLINGFMFVHHLGELDPRGYIDCGTEIDFNKYPLIPCKNPWTEGWDDRPQHYLCFLPKYIVANWLCNTYIKMDVYFRLSQIEHDSRTYYAILEVFYPEDVFNPENRVEFSLK